MSNLGVIFKIPLPRGGFILPLSFPQALSTEFRVHWRGGLARSADRPEMESRPYEFLLQKKLPHWYFYQKMLPFWDLPGTPVVKTLHSQCREQRFDPCSQNWNPTWHTAQAHPPSLPKQNAALEVSWSRGTWMLLIVGSVIRKPNLWQPWPFSLLHCDS